MEIKKVKMFYGQNITIANYYDYPMRELQVPHCLEQEFAKPIEYEQVVYELEIPNAAINKMIYFNGISYAARIYINGQCVMTHSGAWDGCGLELSEEHRGEKLVIHLQRYNFDLDSDFHFRKLLMGFVPDVSMPFTGIYKPIEIISNILEKEISYKTEQNKLIVDEHVDIKCEQVKYKRNGNSFIFADIEYWTPDNPKTYNITMCKDELEIERQIAFVNFKAIENKVYFNDQKFYMKGILHWGYYPEKIIPVLSRSEARQEILKIKNAGFNTIKLCLFFAPDYYYQLCLELGMVLWQEFPLWLPPESELVEERIMHEFPRYVNMVKKYSNITHLTLGCELEGNVSQMLLNKMYDVVKNEFPTKLVCDNSGSNECFASVSELTTDFYDYHFYGELENFNFLVDGFAEEYRYDKPWYFGEFCDSDTWRTIKPSDDDWWLETDEQKNLLLQVHKGFDSGSNLTEQLQLLEGKNIDYFELKEQSILQAHEFRKKIFEKIRMKQLISGYNITTLRDVATTTSGVFDDNMVLKFPKLNETMADVTTIVVPPLRRNWIDGGDILVAHDMHNVIDGQAFEAKLLLSNLQEQSLNVEVSIYLNGCLQDVFIKKTSLFLTFLTDITILDYQLGTNELVIETKVGNEIVSNNHVFYVTEAATSQVVVTNKLDHDNNGQPILYILDSENSIVPTSFGPFYREGIIYSNNEQFNQFFGEYTKNTFENVYPKYYMTDDLPQDFEPLLNRIDARKYYTSYYLVKHGSKYYTTLDLISDVKNKQKHNLKQAIIERLKVYIEGDYNASKNS